MSMASTFDAFTDRGRKMMYRASAKAKMLNHEYLGTEHLLLALVEDRNALASHVLGKLGIDSNRIEKEVLALVQPGPTPQVTMGRLPLTPRVKSIVDHAKDEADSLGHKYIGSEHLLLAMLHERLSVAYHVLSELGVTHKRLKQTTIELLSIPNGTERDSKIEATTHEDGDEWVIRLSSSKGFVGLGAANSKEEASVIVSALQSAINRRECGVVEFARSMGI